MSARVFDGVRLPVGVCVTHDRHRNAVVFAYLGGHKRQRVRRFNPRLFADIGDAIAAAAQCRRRMERQAAR